MHSSYILCWLKLFKKRWNKYWKQRKQRNRYKLMPIKIWSIQNHLVTRAYSHYGIKTAHWEMIGIGQGDGWLNLSNKTSGSLRMLEGILNHKFLPKSILFTYHNNNSYKYYSIIPNLKTLGPKSHRLSPAHQKSLEGVWCIQCSFYLLEKQKREDSG